MNAELYYFEGCPSYARALANLNEALRAEGVRQPVALIRVTDEQDARRKRFVGSPTIRLDGVDVEGPEAEARGYGFGCRVYAGEGRANGWPSIDQLRRAVRASLTESKG